jgi:hypothetical protein
LVEQLRLVERHRRRLFVRHQAQLETAEPDVGELV